MNWITIAWPMIASAILTLGLIELRLGLEQPPRAPRLLFSLAAFAMAAASGLELALMRAHTLTEAALLLRWMNAMNGVVIVTMTTFIWVYFGTGRKWLAFSGPILYAIGEAADLTPGSDMVYKSVTGLRAVETVGGATFNVIEGVGNPWDVIAYLGALVFLVFIVDASVTLWSRGGRRRALIVGGGIALFTLAATVLSALVEAGLVRWPYMVSVSFLATLVAMGSELNEEVQAAARTGEELKESERRMDLASASANLGMWSWDIIHNAIWTTSRTRSLLNLPASGKLSAEQIANAVHPEDRDAMRRAIKRALASGGVYDMEFRVPLGDGQVRWIASRGRVERSAAGRPVLLRGAMMDISARRSVELQLQDLHQQLAHASRVSMMGQLASALAHELSQPLGAILRNAEAAELFLEHEPPDLDELRAILIDIRQDDQRAGKVIERLRALLKRRSFAPRALPVSDLLENVVALIRFDATARRAKLEITMDPGLPPVMGDAIHVQQVLLNLVINAIDAVADLPVDRRQVTVRARHPGSGKVEFAVADRGPGIKPEIIGHLFEPFFTTKASGMGIGLSISRTIIEAHGGHIWAENNAREGATFRFTLPLAEGAGAS